MSLINDKIEFQEIEIRTPKQLKEVLVDCDSEDYDNLPLYAIRKFEKNKWSEWILDYANGIRYADTEEINQECNFLREQAGRIEKNTAM